MVGFCLAAVGIGGYLFARETSVFAITQIEVRGVPPAEKARVSRALEPVLDTSLVRFDADDAFAHLAPLPEIASASFDRDFPHTLRVTVRIDRAVAVLRQGQDAYLIGTGVRVIRQLTTRPYPDLPRIWAPADTEVAVGATLDGSIAGATQTVALVDRTGFAGVQAVRVEPDDLVIDPVSGPEIRLGDSGDLALKLAVASALRQRASDAQYLDVSLPERPVAGYESTSTGVATSSDATTVAVPPPVTETSANPRV